MLRIATFAFLLGKLRQFNPSPIENFSSASAFGVQEREWQLTPPVVTPNEVNIDEEVGNPPQEYEATFTFVAPLNEVYGYLPTGNEWIYAAFSVTNNGATTILGRIDPLSSKHKLDVKSIFLECVRSRRRGSRLIGRSRHGSDRGRRARRHHHAKIQGSRSRGVGGRLGRMGHRS